MNETPEIGSVIHVAAGLGQTVLVKVYSVIDTALGQFLVGVDQDGNHGSAPVLNSRTREPNWFSASDDEAAEIDWDDVAMSPSDVAEAEETAQTYALMHALSSS